MIIPALVNYYDRLAAAPGSDIAPFGFSRQKITFCVTVRPDGSLVEIADARLDEVDARGKSRLAPTLLVVPGQAKPPGSGINPCLLWDNAAYMLGWKSDDPDPDRTRACFEAFRHRHSALEDEIDDEGFRAVCAFLRAHDPRDFHPDERLVDALRSFGVFRLEGMHQYIHERARIVEWFTRSLDAGTPTGADAPRVIPSLTTGTPARIARLHEPKLKGVWGAQSSGAALVSFNIASAESYGKSQGENAPVSEQDAFKYCTALNVLLRERTVRVGDTTVVWWADAAEGDEMSAILGAAMGDADFTLGADAEDAGRADRLERVLADLAAGRMPDLTGTETGFNVLGLAPNAARLAVRFWWRGPIAHVFANLVQHHADARLEPVPPNEAGRPMSIARVVRETARVLGDRLDYDTISPTLAGEVVRAVLMGKLYPMSLLEAIVRRTRADGKLTHARAAIVKACIVRRRRVLAGGAHTTQEVPVSIDPQGPVPYQLGRLFAVLEKTQEDALGSVNSSIRETSFGSASATPAAIFPRLVRLHQHHLGKLEGGRRINRDKLMQEICGEIDRFPKHLNLEGQGLFQVGYYHQRQDLFTKKPNTTEAPEPALAAEEN
ncbi:MAG: type I-C CRISPR-associated protein Cas8c/Csd1 [Planctomycetota bacterium]